MSKIDETVIPSLGMCTACSLHHIHELDVSQSVHLPTYIHKGYYLSYIPYSYYTGNIAALTLYSLQEPVGWRNSERPLCPPKALTLSHQAKTATNHMTDLITTTNYIQPLTTIPLSLFAIMMGCSGVFINRKYENISACTD